MTNDEKMTNDETRMTNQIPMTKFEHPNEAGRGRFVIESFVIVI